MKRVRKPMLRRQPRPRRGFRAVTTALLIIVLLVLTAGVVAWNYPLLKVRELRVSGNSALSVAEVVALSGVNVGDNMLRVSPSQAAVSLAGSPWVETVTVDRSWPSVVTISLRERTPVLHVEQDGQPFLVDSAGRRFLVAPAPPFAPRAAGDALREQSALTAVAQSLAAVPEDVRAHIAAIVVPKPEEITLRLHDGRTVFWGAPDDRENKALALETVLSQGGSRWNISNPRLVSTR